MALDFEQTKDLEEIKQKHKLDLLEKNFDFAKEEHEMKMSRLGLMLQIAEAGGVFRDDKD